MIPKILTDDKTETLVLLWRDPWGWADAANRHWMCADVLYERARVAHDRFQKYMREHMEAITVGGVSQGTRTLEPEEHQILAEARGFINGWFLLVGYTLECGLKACRFAKKSSLISDTLKLDPSITHNLTALCAECGISVSDDEAKLLAVLEYEITHGKYPAPKKYIEVPDIGDLLGQREIALGLISRINSKLEGFPPPD